MDGSGGDVRSIPERIRAEIAASGPMGFDRFMEIALYGPAGYYERPPVGPEGDFLTSPHVHPVFGELVARAIRELFERLDRPEPFRLVEIGGGDGTLAEQLLEHLADLPLSFWAVEASPGARERLRAISGIQIAEAVVDDPHVVLGHELLDNLPFRLVRDGAEIKVAVQAGRLARIEVPADDDLAAVIRPIDEDEGAVPTGALELIDELSRVLRRGYALFVDYGSDTAGGGPVHGYRAHRPVEDVLAEPGATDITAGVDFGLLADAATTRGLQAFPSVPQRRSLELLGFHGWMRAELATQSSLLNRGEGIEAVRRWAGRSSASTLVDPQRLGRLRWFVLAGPDLPCPSFLAAEEP